MSSELPNKLTSLPYSQQYVQEQYEAPCYEIQGEMPNEEGLRREHEAMEIVIQAKETIKDEKKLMSFFQIIQTCQDTPIQAFAQLHTLCQGLPELQELLLDLLTPEQALELNPIIYAQHCYRNDMKSFCLKIKTMYGDNPVNQGSQAQAAKIFKDLHNFISQDSQQPSVDELRNFASKLFKGNQEIIDLFLSFMPGHTEERERAWNCIDPEMIDLSDEENEAASESKHNEHDNLNGYEHIKDIPETDEEKLYGTEQCPCQCHPKNQPTSSHCIHCSIRFINGKIYARDGKNLKPVKVKYPSGKNPFTQCENIPIPNSTISQVSPTVNSVNVGRNQN